MNHELKLFPLILNLEDAISWAVSMMPSEWEEGREVEEEMFMSDQLGCWPRLREGDLKWFKTLANDIVRLARVTELDASVPLIL